MPKKGKGTGKKKGKKGVQNTAKGQPSDLFETKEIPSPFKPGERLIKFLSTPPTDIREIHGVKVSKRVLEQMTPQEIRDLRTVFEMFDLDADGLITASELRTAMCTLGFKLSRQETKQITADVCKKGKRCLEFREFLEVVIDRQGDARDIYSEILQGFKMFDYDSSGHISQDNLRQACQAAKIKFTQKELEEMMEEADINGDGYVDRSEFIRIMLQTNLF